MRALWFLLLLASCASPTAAGDALVRNGEHEAAIDAYDEAAERHLTSFEQSEIRARRAEAMQHVLEQRFDATMRLTEPSVQRRQLAELYAEAPSAANAEDLSERILQAAVEVSEPEFAAIEASVDNGDYEVALDHLFALSGEIVASEAANRRVITVRSRAARALRERAKSEPVMVAKLLDAWADRLDYSEFSAADMRRPAVQLGAASTLCDQPLTFSDQGIVAHLNLTCETRVQIGTESEPYYFKEIEEYTAYEESCAKVRTTTTTTQQYSRKVFDGVYYSVWETGVETVSTPSYSTSCTKVPYIAQREVEAEGTREFQVRHIGAGVRGTVTFELPAGPIERPVQLSLGGSVRAVPLASDSAQSAFENDEATDVARFNERMPAALYAALQDVAREALAEDAASQRAVAQHAQDPVAARAAAARAVLFGGSLAPELADLGFAVGKPSPWIEPRDASLLAVEQIRIEYRPGTANEAFEVGFSTLRWDFAARNVRMSDLSVQPDRVGYGALVGQGVSLLSTKLFRRPYGFVFFDELQWHVVVGARTSEPYVYPRREKAKSQEDAFFYEAGLGGQLLVGPRSRFVGLLAGVRGRATTHTVGDARAASAGVPLAARLELRFSPRYPIVLEAWGFSPVGDRAAMGGELTFAVGNLANILAEASYQEADTRVGGISALDRVDLGRRPNLFFTLGLQFAGLGMFGL